MTQIDLSYVKDAKDGWQLSGWKIMSYNGRKELRETTTATVTSREINPTLPPEEFALTFKPGTVVRDTIEKSLYVQTEANSKRIITNEEYMRPNVTVEELLRTKPGMAGLPPARPWQLWVFVGGIGVLLLLAALWYWQKKRLTARRAVLD